MIAPGLTANSRLYRSEVDCYERFSQCEDSPGLIEEFLIQFIAGKRVLDLGCGTGKYLAKFAPIAQSYIGLDRAGAALAISNQKSFSNHNVTLMKGDARRIELPDNSVDLTFASWVLGTIRTPGGLARAVAECRRVTRLGGEILLIENDCGGDFERIRGRFPDSRATVEYNEALQQQFGFEICARFTTRFEFETREEAVGIFGAIWGAGAMAMITSPIIEHRIVIFRFENSEKR